MKIKLSKPLNPVVDYFISDIANAVCVGFAICCLLLSYILL